MKQVLAGGAVVTRQHRGLSTEVLLIHRPRYLDWTLPKGKIEPGESLPACAVREVWEETGVRIRLGMPLAPVRYATGKGIKHVSYWAATALDITERAPDEEVDEVIWLPVAEAVQRLSFEGDQVLVAQCLQQPSSTALLVVRHAKAMDRKNWSHRDPARPLNARGRRQAMALAATFGAYRVEDLVSSTSKRCVATFTPYAQSRGLPIDLQSVLSEEEGIEDRLGVMELIDRVRRRAALAGRPAAVCCHRPVLPHILPAAGLGETTLSPAECLVAHLGTDGTVLTVERHRPQQ